jgi:hypothetical protein
MNIKQLRMKYDRINDVDMIEVVKKIAAGRTMRQLHGLAGVSRNAWWLWLNGTHRPTFGNWVALQDLINTNKG